MLVLVIVTVIVIVIVIVIAHSYVEQAEFAQPMDLIGFTGADERAAGGILAAQPANLRNYQMLNRKSFRTCLIKKHTPNPHNLVVQGYTCQLAAS